MDSCLSSEAYRELLDSDRDEDGDNRAHAQLLSFMDWDVLDAASAARLLDQYTLDRRGVPGARKRRLCKPTHHAHPTVLPPLPASPRLYMTGDHRQHTTAAGTSTTDGVELARDELTPRSPQRAQAASPSKPRACTTSTVPMTLPPLDVQVLQRRRVFLNPTGASTIGVEEILQLQECISPSKPQPSTLQLTAIPRKCTLDDEVALMPCHSLQYRYMPSLVAECWREPLRDRDKNWSRDELNVILALHRATDQSAYAMTNPHRQRKGKWRRWEAMKLHVHSSTIEATEMQTRQHQQDLPQQILIRSQGAMISRTYCVVSVLGVGIYGRLYSAGLAERHGTSRFLRFDAYDPATSRVYSLVVTLSDLEWLFQTRQELLVAGKKHTIIKALIALLYFQYPRGDGDEHQDAEQQHPPTLEALGDDWHAALSVTQTLPVLCISPEEKLSDSTRRRREREERLRQEEEERLRALALLLRLPRRARHRLLCQVVRVSGHKFIVSLYHLPSQVRNFLILAYHPLSSRTFPLTVGVMEAASLSRIFTLPHRWSAEQKLLVAQSLIPLLRFNGTKAKRVGAGGGGAADGTVSDYAAYHMGLAIRDYRTGAVSEWLALPPVRTHERLHEELVHKYQVDGQRSLQLVCDAKMQSLTLESDTRVLAFEAQIRDAETQKESLRARDTELKEKIEEINSGNDVALQPQTSSPAPLMPAQSGGTAGLAGDAAAAAAKSKTRHHELRRGYKAERQQIKGTLKTLSDRIAGWKRDIAAVRERQTQERVKALQTLAKAVRALESEAVINTRGILESDSGTASAVTAVSKASSGDLKPVRIGGGQRTRLARAYIDLSLVFIASSACPIYGKRFRCSVFQVLAPALAERGESSDDEKQPGDSARLELLQSGSLLRVVVYDPVSSCNHALELTQLDWISYTKQHHDAQLLVPNFEIESSPVTERLRFLHNALTASRDALGKTFRSATTTTKAKPVKRVTKKLAKTRAQLVLEMRNCLLEHRKLERAAPWHCLIAALGERMRFEVSYDNVSVDAAHAAPSGIILDRCVFRTVLPIVVLAGGDDDESASRSAGAAAMALSTSNEDAGVIYCHVRVLQELQRITFEVFDPQACELYSLVHPDSAELAKEFAVETFLEQQMHLEAIAMSLLFFVNDDTGQLDIRFED